SAGQPAGSALEFRSDGHTISAIFKASRATPPGVETLCLLHIRERPYRSGSDRPRPAERRTYTGNGHSEHLGEGLAEAVHLVGPKLFQQRQALEQTQHASH